MALIPFLAAVTLIAGVLYIRFVIWRKNHRKDEYETLCVEASKHFGITLPPKMKDFKKRKKAILDAYGENVHQMIDHAAELYWLRTFNKERVEYDSHLLEENYKIQHEALQEFRKMRGIAEKIGFSVPRSLLEYKSDVEQYVAVHA